MSELALKLIRENIEKHKRGEDATVLDLGNCGMTEVPEEIGECFWVEKLIFSAGWYEWESEYQEYNFSSNAGELNRISVLPFSISNIKNLKVLIFTENPINDLSQISGLLNLQQLVINSTNITDLAPLSTFTKLKYIDCSYTPVISFNPLIGLPSLKSIANRGTQIADLTSLSKLESLEKLFFTSDLISDLSPIAELVNLETLTFSGGNFSELEPLRKLIKLEIFSCSSTNVSDLSPLSMLENLQDFSCDNTPVFDLSPLSKLDLLREFSCIGTPVSDVSPLAKLKNLESLNFSNTLLEDLAPLSGMKKLKTLWCFNTRITDLSPISDFSLLTDFSCQNTNVGDVKPLENLLSLKRIACSETLISDLSPFIQFIKKGGNVIWSYSPGADRTLSVGGCPLICPPLEVAQESPQAVRDYFEELGDDGQKLNEVKVIFLGEASAGKTSLVKRLMGENFDSKESQTHGIRIRKMPFAMDDGDIVTAHLWDFGGQEVMHATHQFFLSQRSVYVLLLNSRNDDQAEKWLKHAASFGGRSPVLVVLNKIDENPSFQVDNKRLKEKYPQIREFFRISAKTDNGINEFREALRSEIDRADTRRTPFPPHWLAVKEHFSSMEADYIESAEYRKVCADKGVTRQFSQDVLLKFLHDLGVVINFDKLKNFDTQILNPLWLTNGVYRIINSEIVANTGGLLQEEAFDAVINDPRYNKENTTDRVFEYPKSKLQYIVRVMQEFELCFQLNTRTYVVPQLLPVQEPEFKVEGAVLRFVIHFPDFMPDSIFPRLMVKLHTFLATGDSGGSTSSRASTTSAWRTGMILHKPNIFKALARVRWDKEDQKILVDVCGDERRRFLSFIRETVKEIVNDFTNINFSELVPIPESKEFLEYAGLVEAEKAEEKEVFVWQVKKKLSVADLLDGVEESVMRDEVEQLPVRAFVSYSHKDLEYLKELRSALSTLVRLNKLQIWDDRDIDAGDEWENVIFQQLEESDIVLCLVSSDFVASDFCYKKEFTAALEAHRKGEKTIVPIMLRKTDWKDLPLAEIQGTPGEWITLAKDKDEAWTKVSESLRPALDKAKQRKKALLDKRKGEFQ